MEAVFSLFRRFEYAQVLSWSAEYARAADAYNAVLEREPRNARALAGLARNYRWRGNGPAAARMYRRALDVEDTVEVRAELSELRSEYRPTLEFVTEHFSDKSDFVRRDYGIEGSTYLDLATRIRLSLTRIDASHSQDDVAPEIRSPHDRDRARELSLAVDRRWGERLRERGRRR